MTGPAPVLLATIVALALAACGTGGQQEPDASATTAGSVTIESFDYRPEDLEITAGTTVTWTNGDMFAHTVTAGGPPGGTGSFDGQLGELDRVDAQGTTFSFTFEEPGTYPYFCRFHPDMRAAVIVR